jgi:hypothetical protein
MERIINNRLLVKGNPVRIRKFLNAIESEDQQFDFERVIPMPDLISDTCCGLTTIDGPEVKHWYQTNDGHDRLFTEEEERELRELGHRCWRDWTIAKWGTMWNAGEISLDERTIRLGYVVIEFQTIEAPPWPILRRLQEMFPELGFACRWYREGDSDHRYLSEMSQPIGRSDRDGGPGQKFVATLYMTTGEFPQFFVKTETVTEAPPQEPSVPPILEMMTEAEAHRWLLSPDVKLLALTYPEMPKR